MVFFCPHSLYVADWAMDGLHSLKKNILERLITFILEENIY